MTRVLLDTSAYSAFLRGSATVRDVVRAAGSIFVSPVVLGELRAGFAAGGRPEQNEAELRSFLGSPRVCVLAIDEETSAYYAAIHRSLREAGTPIPTNDLWIAASAMQHGLPVVTTAAHFQPVQQILVQHIEVGR